LCRNGGEIAHLQGGGVLIAAARIQLVAHLVADQVDATISTISAAGGRSRS
jgi:hypothetical protein